MKSIGLVALAVLQTILMAAALAAPSVGPPAKGEASGPCRCPGIRQIRGRRSVPVPSACR